MYPKHPSPKNSQFEDAIFAYTYSVIYLFYSNVLYVVPDLYQKKESLR
jgi:hypothetical protein